jgi:hypothetical protein
VSKENIVKDLPPFLKMSYTSGGVAMSKKKEAENLRSGEAGKKKEDKKIRSGEAGKIIRNVNPNGFFNYRGRKYRISFKAENYSNFKVNIVEHSRYADDYGIIFTVSTVNGDITARGIYTAWPANSESPITQEVEQ